MFLRKLGVCCIDLEFFFFNSFFLFPLLIVSLIILPLILKMSCNFIFFIAPETNRESVAIVQDGVVFHDIVIVGYLVYLCFFCFRFFLPISFI